MRTKFLIWEVDERRGDRDLELMSVSMTRGVVPRSDLTDDEPRADDLSNYKVCRAGDIVVNRMSAYQGALGLAQQDGIVSPDYIVFRLSHEVAPRWLHHVMRSSWFVSEMAARIRGIGSIGTGNVRTPRVSAEEIREIRLDVPDRERQQAIADYLDTETARIDALINKKQRMIELLVARRLSAMEESLGGGRGAAAYLVGSEATLHRAVPLKRLLSATIAGGTPDSNDSDYWTDEQEGVAWVAIGDMADCSTTTGTARRLTPAGLAASRLRVAPAGTLLFAMYASLGKLTVTAMPCVWNQAIIGLVPDQTKADAEYVALWLEALRPHLPLLARSTTQDNLNAEQVRSLPIPLITVEEQRRLVLGLLPVLQQLSTARAVLERQIDLLREHRQALITAAVTGELVIPGVAA